MGTQETISKLTYRAKHESIDPATYYQRAMKAGLENAAVTTFRKPSFDVQLQDDILKSIKTLYLCAAQPGRNFTANVYVREKAKALNAFLQADVFES